MNCHPERSRGICCLPASTKRNQGIRTKTPVTPMPTPRQTPAPKGRKKTAQDEVLGTPRKKTRSRRARDGPHLEFSDYRTHLPEPRGPWLTFHPAFCPVSNADLPFLPYDPKI